MYSFVIFFCSLFFALATLDVDPLKSEIWGPGLDASDIVLPARYFFVQLYNRSNHRLHDSPEVAIAAKITGRSDQRPCRAWVNVLDRKDGSFIVRFKVYNMCYDMKIEVTYKNDHLLGSPISFKKAVLPDDCVCPVKLNLWMDKMKCGVYPQIDRDLKKFNSMDFKLVAVDILSKFDKPNSVSICHYVVKNNNVYRKCYGQYVGFSMFIDSILLSLTRKVQLPDFEFFSNLGDWPLVKKSAQLLPMFSWCGSDETQDIVMPTYELTEATLECMGRVQLDMLSVQGNTGPKWNEKTEKGFWMGRDSRQERLDLIDLARKHPDILNASMTNFFFFKDKEDIYGPKVKHISFFDFFQFKYQINIDGTVAAYRLPYLLAGDAVVVKQDSPYYEHFYHELIPWEHYVPVKRNLTDLIERLNWLKDNDEKAKKISQAGQRFARENLMPVDIFCYYAVLFTEWSKKLQDEPEIIEGMEHVKQAPPETKCECPVEHDEL